MKGEKLRKSSCKFWIFLGLVIGLVASLGIAQVIHSTSGPFPCSMCHVMKPMIKAYENDVHGGKNPHGIKVSCADCHLPHDNVPSYLWGKFKISAHDAWAQLTYDKDKIDWQAKRKRVKEFVYESACLSCHSNLKDAMHAGKSFLAHRDYFEKKTQKTCLDCHSNVGHKDLGYYLPKNNKGEN